MRTLGRLGLITLVLLALELLLQGFYRLTTGDVLWRRTALPIFDRDELRCFRLQPNLAYRHRTSEYDVMIYTNAQGLRTDEGRRPIELDKPPGVRRILFLGPSYAFGWGSSFEHSYAAQVGRGIGACPPVEIVNLGTPGQQSGTQLCWLRTTGSRLRPDLVIETVFGHPGALEDDCPDELSCPLVEHGYLVRASGDPGPGWGRLAAEGLKRSSLVFYAWYLQRRYFATSVTLADAADMPSDDASTRFGDLELLADRYEDYVGTVRRAAGTAVQVAFVYIPPAYVVHAEDLKRHFWITPAEINHIPALVARLQVELDGRGVSFVDATPALRRAAANARAYYWVDTHLTPLGNSVVAEAVLEKLSQEESPRVRSHDDGTIPN